MARTGRVETFESICLSDSRNRPQETDCCLPAWPRMSPFCIRALSLAGDTDPGWRQLISMATHAAIAVRF